MKNKILPSKVSQPAAIKGPSGNLICDKNSLLRVYKNEYINRLSSKPPLSQYKEAQTLKEELFTTRMKISSMIKTDQWKLDNIIKVCKRLKNGKSRDSHGLTYELFKPEIAGPDLMNSLVVLFNKIKDQLIIPEFMQLATITSLYKRSGERSDLSNQRGLFCVSKVRSLLDKLIHADYYDHIDSNLSDSNVGGRKKRNIRDHIFVINSVINDMIRGDADDCDIQAIDIVKCFDEMGYAETHNDLWDVCPQDNKFNLIAKMDEEVNVKVKTPVGQTEEFKLNNVVLQGTVLAPLKCSIQCETMAFDAVTTDEGETLYKYKGSVYIPPLQMVDDILTVSKCGLQAVTMNANLNVKIESKKLRLSHNKCKHMHISKKGSECMTNLKVHQKSMSKVDSVLYLGDKINIRGTVDENVKLRELKAVGILSQINSILKNVTLGIFYIRTALILREAMLINGIFTNAECWNFVSLKNIKVFEDADARFFSSLFESPRSTNRVLYFLETRKIPVRHILAERRLMYLYNILSKDDHVLIKKTYDSMKLKPVKFDWIYMITDDREKYDIQLSDSEIKEMKRDKYKKSVNKAVDK